MRHKNWTRVFAMLFAIGAPLASGCTAQRVCTGCKYKSTINFSGLPTGTMTSATMELTVKHSGTCPQTGPNNCTEKITYDIKCKLGTSSTLVTPFFIDAAPTVSTHTARITVVQGGTTTRYAGTVDLSSNVDGGGPPPSTIPTPCPLPDLNPYDPFPAVY